MTDLSQDPNRYASLFTHGPEPRSSGSGIFQLVAEEAAGKAQEARGFWENAKWQGAAVAKEFGDSVMNIGSTAAKLIGGVEGMIEGQGFGAGWENVAQSFEQTMGTRNPGVMEFGARIAGELGIPSDVSVGKKTDELIDKRLGNYAAAGRGLGTVLSFATGPGAAVGRGAAGLTRPVAQVGERMLAKAVGRTLGVADDATNALVSQGRAWDYFAQTARMQDVMGLRQQLLQAIGRNANDILSTTAANVAQAYAMSDDDQRMGGVLTAAYMSPFMVPIARMGQAAERAIMEGGLGGAEAAAIRNAVASFERGELGPTAVQRAIAKAVGPGRRFLASAIVAPAIEGTAFMGLDPNAIDLAGKWWGGDADAGAQLAAMMIGTTTGLAVAKYGFPDHLAPMWKAYRPDLNRLDRIYTEAEAAKRAMEQPQEPAKPQEPKPAQSIEGNEKLQAAESMKAAAAAEQRRQATAAETMAERFGAAEATVRADYGWAAEPTAAMLRGDWNPQFNPDKSVTLQYGRDHMVTVQRNDTEGISIRLREPSLKVLRDFGLEPPMDSPDRSSVSTLETEIRGPLAQKALDDLAMIGSLRRMQADRNFERRGFREVAPGVWADDGSGTYYTPQLDGTYATKDGPVGKWTGSDEMVVVGPSPELWDNPTAAALGEWALVKATTFPDPVVDGILLEAVMQARTGNSAGARHLRQFFENTRPEQLAEMLKPSGDREFAMRLGSLASTTDTPELALARGMSDLRPLPQGVQPEPRGDLPYKPPEPGSNADAERVAQKAAQDPRVRETIKALGAEKTVPVKVSPRQAQFISRYVPRKSALGRALEAVSEPTTIDVLESEIVRLSDEFKKFAGKALRQEGNNEKIYQADIQSAKAFIERAAAEIKNRSFTRFVEPLKSDQGTAETGSINPLTAQQRAELKRGVSERAAQARDYFFETEAQAVTDAVPGEKLGYEARRGFARGAEIAGEAASLTRPLHKGRKRFKQALAQEAVPQGYQEGEGTVPAWVDVVDARREPATQAERTIRDVGQSYNSFLRRKAVEAGTTRIESVDGQQKRVPVRDEGPAVQQRWRGKDFDIVMNDAGRRKTVFERWLRANPDDMTVAMDPETNKVVKRRTTVDDLEAEWQKQPSVPRGSDEAEAAAIEFTRRFKNVAYKEKIDGQVFEMYETNPYRVMERTISKQSAQIAANEMWGQNIPAAERKAMLAENEAAVKAGQQGLPEAVVRNLQKGGAVERVNRFEEAGKATLRDTTNLRDAVETARRLVERVQGGQPVQKRGLARSQAWSNLQAVRSAALSAAGGIRDIPDIIFRLPSFAGARRTFSALWAMTGGGPASRGGRTRREMFDYAERVGAIQRQMGDFAFEEAKSWARKFADLAGYPSNFLERLKGVVSTIAADNIIATAKAGKATPVDLQMMQDMMKLSAEDVLAIKSGKISPALEQQFRREFVSLITSKTPAQEGSSFAASPNTRAWFNFVNWFTRRTGDNIRAFAAVRSHAKEKGWSAPETQRAMRRLLGLAIGTTISGALGNALVQTFTATLAGDPIDDGLKRAWDQLSYAPAATMLSGLRSGVIGGPLNYIIEAAADPDKGFSWSSITAPSGLAYTLFNAAQAVGKGDVQGFVEWMSRVGVVPFRTQLKELMFTGLASFASDTAPRADASLVRAWEKLEGVDRISAPRTKDEAFYDALNEFSTIAKQYPDDPKAAIKAGGEHLRKALELAPEESVASAIEARQLTKHLTLEQRQKLAEFVNDSDRMSRIYQHDKALREMASVVRKTMEGAYPTPWEQDLNLMREQAAMGGADKWNAVVERALDETSQRMVAGDGLGDQLDQLAEVMSIYGDQVGGMFDERTNRFLANPGVDSGLKARRIARVLRERALDRAKSERRRQAREAAGG